MKLSVIVPVYNVQQYLGRCIDSILGQSFSDFELLLIDDGSTDRSLALCQEYAATDSRITVLHQENQGQASARNKGLDIARGEFVVFVDSDDSIDTEMFRYMMDLATAHNADIVTCELDLVGPEGEPLKEPITQYPDKAVPEEELLYNFYHTDQRRGYTSGVVCAKIYRRTLFSDLRFPTGRIYEDTYMIPYLYEKTKMLVITTKPFYKYWIRNGSTVNGEFREKHLDALYVMEDQYRFFRDRSKYGQTHLAQFTYMRYFVRYYYTVRMEHPESIPAIKPYKRAFIKMLPSLFRNPEICRMEKLCILVMLLRPKWGIRMTGKYFPESLPEQLRPAGAVRNEESE